MLGKECFEYGKLIPDLNIGGKNVNYRVLNEREVRAGAGIMLIIGLSAFAMAYFEGNYFYVKGVVILFFIDFLIRVLWGTCPSPISILARFMVRKQDPEWVGALQKRFAWSIGLLMAGSMMIMLVALDMRGIQNIILCVTCLFFMWLEVSFGLCVGCKMYYGLIDLGVLAEPKERPRCAGGACSIDKKGID